jgi:Poly A polymerase head domain/Probable RNA and SrmB- binding site of polymerase A
VKSIEEHPPEWHRLRDELLRLFPDLGRIGGDGFVVGGAIRDLLRGEPPADVDVACTDPLACSRALGRRVITLGRDHLRAYRVVAPPHTYDFAEILGGDIARDLARRDFSVNAMAVSLGSGELLDLHGGRDDLARRLVRMVDPQNLDDDPLRLLKCVRMAVKLRFSIDQATTEAIRERAPAILRVAPERVSYELSIIFSAGAFRRAVELMRAAALDVPLFGREIDASAFCAEDVPLSAAFALIVGDPPRYAERWKWSTSLLREVLSIRQLLRTDGDLRVALYDAGPQIANDFRAALRALGRDDRLVLPDFTIRALLSGDEIASLTGMPAGQKLGRMKRDLLEAQIRGEIATREKAEAFVRRWTSTSST